MKNLILKSGMRLLLVCFLVGGIYSCKSGKTTDETTPEAELSAVEETQEDTGAAVSTELQRIHFDYDRYNIRSDAAGILDKNIQYLKDHPDVWIQVEGHCDDRGSAEYNLALGEKRASATKDYMINMGIDAKRISVISYGEEKALENGSDEYSWSMNRRAEFVIVSRGM